jgi:CHAT domain-containing protein
VDQTVLSYALMPEGLVVWVFDDRGVRSTLVRLDSEGLIRSAAEFTEMCSDKNSDLGEIQAAGRKLFDLLISPVLGEINPSRTLVIEADDLIADLPFGALLGRDGHYLGETYRVVSSFGLLYQQVLRSSSRFSPADHALIIGSTANTTEELSLEPAPDVLNEANEVAKRFIKPQLLEGSDATAEKMESFLPQAHIVHYVGHAVSSPKMEGLLVFASSTSGKKSSVLWGANRVSPKLFAQSKLVVLSACGTGKSYRGRKKINGELMRSIFASGVPDIVASRWNVDSSATKEYMDAFYSNLLAGRSASSAVQQAETEMRTRPDRRHPCYWAAFTIFGRG